MPRYAPPGIARAPSYVFASGYRGRYLAPT